MQDISRAQLRTRRNKELKCSPSALLGRGPVGSVFDAVLHDNEGVKQQRVAVKVLNVSILPPSEYKHMRSEIERQTHCTGHPNVLVPYGGVLEEGFYAVVSKRCGANLADMFYADVARVSWRAFTMRERLRKLLGVASGLAFLHRHDLIHGCIKPNNVLLDPDSDALMLTDFGFDRTFSAVRRVEIHVPNAHPTPSAARNLQRSFLYTAPELFRDSRPSRAADVFSLVMLFAESLSHDGFDRIWHPGRTDARVLERGLDACMAELKTQADREQLNALPSILIRAWNAEPSARPTAQQLYEQLDELLNCTSSASSTSCLTWASVGSSTPASEATVDTAHAHGHEGGRERVGLDQTVGADDTSLLNPPAEQADPTRFRSSKLPCADATVEAAIRHLTSSGDPTLVLARALSAVDLSEFANVFEERRICLARVRLLTEADLFEMPLMKARARRFLDLRRRILEREKESPGDCAQQ